MAHLLELQVTDFFPRDGTLRFNVLPFCFHGNKLKVM